ncbi:MAG: CPBP family glutamic-type intramembrane protease [Oceanipulchritudo sp.]
MSDSPILILIVFAGALYLLKLWREDLLAEQTGHPNPRALPGAAPVPAIALWIGGIGAVLLVLLETAGELALGVSAEQTDITFLFLFAMVGAGVLEEVLFRGYLVVSNKGRKLLISSIIGFSLLFALLHFQYYTEIPEEGAWWEFQFAIDTKAGWSLLLLFLNSLWFYTVRFFKWNPRHSLLPCFVAHVASNLGVFLVKLLQGHVTGLY